MKRAFIFANGNMASIPPVVNEICSSDLVIAADGGSHHCKTLGITPDLIIGDLDSLDDAAIAAYTRAGVEINRYPAHKDETDLELALIAALQRSVSEVHIIGGLGARWDMTIANVLLAAHQVFAQLSIRLFDGTQELVLLRGASRLDLDDRQGDTISLIPFGGDALGVTSVGLEYPLLDETLYFGSPRGVSNTILGAHAQVSLRQGTLLCCMIRGEDT